jgi:type IV conjugative transfer system protein TraE
MGIGGCFFDPDICLGSYFLETAMRSIGTRQRLYREKAEEADPWVFACVFLALGMGLAIWDVFLRSMLLEKEVLGMNFSFARKTLASALKQRDLALWCCVGLTLTNMVLAFKLAGTEEHWVLMPQYHDEHRLEVTKSKYSDEYLMDWAAGILNAILCANPDSIDWKISQLLKISLNNYGPLKEQLKGEAQKIKQDKISTVFYPNSFKVNQAKRTVEVAGEHSVYFGGDSAPIVTKKTFQVSWAIRSHGVILLEGIKEMKKQGEQQWQGER